MKHEVTIRSRHQPLLGLVAMALLSGCKPAPEPQTQRPQGGSPTATAPAPIAAKATAAPPEPPPTASTQPTALPEATPTASPSPPTASAQPATPPPPPAAMVKIDRGAFVMGCPKKADKVCRDEEKPRHWVQLSPYEIDVYEVSVGHYKACVDAGVCELPLAEPERLSESQAKAAAICREQFRPEFSKRPIVCVTMHMAQEYCEWRDKRLPTEAEWERAARGDNSLPQGGRLFPWGDEPPNGELACVEVDGPCDVGTHPKGASAFGLHDMAGNAAEWVWDFYDANYYASSPKRDPDGSWDMLPIHRRSCSSVTCNTVRGGSWQDEPQELRSTARWPKGDDHDYRFTTIGFRCARSTEKSRREYFANRTNIWNAKRAEEAKKWLRPQEP